MQSLNKGERLFTIALLFLIIAFGIFIRVQNKEALEDASLLGPDSYRYFRQTQQIVATGELPHIDTMRNSPSGIDNTTSTTLFPFLLAKTFAAVHTFIPSLELYQFAIFTPIFFITLAALLFYAFTKRLFGNIAALFATLIFLSTPGLLFASSKGYVDTSPITILFFIACLFLYAEACRAQPMWKRVVYMFVSGITISFLGLIWKGVGFTIGIVVLYNFLKLCAKGYDKTDFTQFASWIFPILVVLLGFTKMYRSQLFAPHVFLAVGVPIGFGILAAAFISIKSLNLPKFCSTLFNRVPLGLMISVFFLVIGSAILTIRSQSLNWILTLINAIFYPFGKNGIMEFVDELHPITFNMWRDGYGLILLFAIPGLCLLTYTHPSGNRKSFILHCTLTVIAMLGIAISRFVPIFSFSVPWITGNLIFAISVLTIFANTIYQFTQTTATPTETTKENDRLLLLAWFLPSYMLTCSAIRFDLFLVPVFAMFAGYMLNSLFTRYMPYAKNNWIPLILIGALLSWQVLICGKDILTFLISITTLDHLSLKLPEHLQLLITLFVTFIFLGFILQNLFYKKQRQYSFKKACILIVVCLITWLSIIGIYRLGPTQSAFITVASVNPYPDRYTRNAFNLIKDNTTSDAVIAANWTLGSMINEIAERATIVDEEQNFEKIREMSKVVFYGKNEEEALKFLKQHGATYLLLLPFDMLHLNIHYFAASGHSDVIEQFIPITPFTISDKSDQKLEYLANHPLEIKINTEYNPETVKKAIIPFSWEGENFTISNPASIMIHENNSVTTVSVKELIIADRQWYFPEAEINGAVWKRSGITQGVSSKFTDLNALYISPEARESLVIKLFLGEHSDHFKLVYASQESYGPVPIKIWKIQYEE